MTSITKESLSADLSPFADIGSGTIKVSERKGLLSLKMLRDGRDLKISVDSNTGVASIANGKNERTYASLASMLSSEYFANLKRWADAQKDILSRSLQKKSGWIPLNARSHSGACISSAGELHELMIDAQQCADSTSVLLLDGPAGIGKTNLIEQLALYRAEIYKEKSCALLLHVKSRGRVLSNLQDLMAFSLQTIRSHITYDQIPVLVKHGLVVIAIDGFDELGDPNGYELAWAQLSELVEAVRGEGSIILAGRDTFFGRASLLRDVRSIREDLDSVISLTLFPPSPAQAKEWLLAHGWTEAGLGVQAVSVLLETDSYALRPMFLRLLSENIKPKDVQGKSSSYLAPMLLDYVIKREAKLFGRAVEAVMPLPQIEQFLWRFLREVARDMADSQTESLDANSLGWIAEVALESQYAPDVISIIKNRASVIALLVADERPGYMSFMHSYLMNYFVSWVAVDALADGEVPKFIRRNLLGSEFLSVFSDTSSHLGSSEPALMENFFDRTYNFSHRHSHIDRGIRNVGALLISALPEAPVGTVVSIGDYQVDDVVLKGTSVPVRIERCVINHFDVRGADMSEVIFEDVSVIKVVADDSTRFPLTFPSPKIVIDGVGRQIVDANEIRSWIDVRGGAEVATGRGVGIDPTLKRHPVYKLLGKACRLRQYWLREEDDIYAERILSDSFWPSLSKILTKHDFLRVEDRPAAGRTPSFVHIRQKQRLISEDESDLELMAFFQDLAEEVSNF